MQLQGNKDPREQVAGFLGEGIAMQYVVWELQEDVGLER